MYTFRIPKEKITFRGVDYFIKAVYDELTTTISDSNNKSFSLRVKIGSIQPDNIFNRKKYSMISVPDFDGSNLFKEITKNLGEINNKVWRIFRWESDRYSELTTEDILSIKAGDGLWFISNTDKTKLEFNNILTSSVNL